MRPGDVEPLTRPDRPIIPATATLIQTPNLPLQEKLTLPITPDENYVKRDLYQVAKFLEANRELGVAVRDKSKTFHLALTRRIEHVEKHAHNARNQFRK